MTLSKAQNFTIVLLSDFFCTNIDIYLEFESFAKSKCMEIATGKIAINDYLKQQKIKKFINFDLVNEIN